MKVAFLQRRRDPSRQRRARSVREGSGTFRREAADLLGPGWEGGPGALTCEGAEGIFATGKGRGVGNQRRLTRLDGR